MLPFPVLKANEIFWQSLVTPPNTKCYKNLFCASQVWVKDRRTDIKYIEGNSRILYTPIRPTILSGGEKILVEIESQVVSCHSLLSNLVLFSPCNGHSTIASSRYYRATTLTRQRTITLTACQLQVLSLCWHTADHRMRNLNRKAAPYAGHEGI